MADISDGPFESLVFVPVPEPKSVKNRINVDLFADAPGGGGRPGGCGRQVLRSEGDEIAALLRDRAVRRVLVA